MKVIRRALGRAISVRSGCETLTLLSSGLINTQ